MTEKDTSDLIQEEKESRKAILDGVMQERSVFSESVYSAFYSADDARRGIVRFAHIIFIWSAISFLFALIRIIRGSSSQGYSKVFDSVLLCWLGYSLYKGNLRWAAWASLAFACLIDLQAIIIWRVDHIISLMIIGVLLTRQAINGVRATRAFWRFGGASHVDQTPVEGKKEIKNYIGFYNDFGATFDVVASLIILFSMLISFLRLVQRWAKV